jgi:hypothetical protein
MAKKKKPVKVLPRTMEAAHKMLLTNDQQLGRIFDNYVVIGLRKRPPQEAAERGSEQGLMHFRKGPFTVVGGMVFEALVALLLDFFKEQGLSTMPPKEVIAELVNKTMQNVLDEKSARKAWEEFLAQLEDDNSPVGT